MQTPDFRPWLLSFILGLSVEAWAQTEPERTPKVPAAESESRRLKFLPFVGANLEAARYLNADEDFAWVGWIGATVELVEKGKWSGFFHPNVETVLGHRIRSFEALQANYSLEIGAHRALGQGRISPFFHHVSRHVQDRDKRQAIDWNLLGVKYDSPWPSAWNRRGAFLGSLAFTTLASGVGYKWEVRMSADADILRRENGGLFALLDLRHVGADASPEFPRDGVTDLRAEIGLRRWALNSQAALFLAFERRGDALIPQALITKRVLFGFRMRGARSATPSTLPLP